MDRAGGRTEKLSDQLPEAGFPRGAGVASAAGLALLVLTALFCLLGLTTAGPIAALFDDTKPVVPSGVATAQRRDAEAFAKTVGASATSAAHDLQAVADSHMLDDGRSLGTLSAVYPSWRGIALLEAASRTLIDAHGEPVQADALAGADLGRPTVRPYTPPGGVPLMLSTVPLPGGRVLVASTALKIALPPPGGALRQHLRLVSDDGTILGNVGADVSADAETRDLLGTAASAARAGSGVLTGAAATGSVPFAAVVAYAPVTTGAGALGLSVVTATWLPADTAPARWPGLVPALALLVLALAGTILLRRGLVSPIRRLRDDALAVASGTATGPVRQAGTIEVSRIAAALERCRLRLRDDELEPRKPRGIPARLLIGLVMVSLLSWSAAVFFTLGQHSAQVPATLVTEQGLRLARSADALRSAVTSGLTGLRAAARLNAGKLMIDRLAGDPAFRSVYVLDPAGAVSQRAGKPPLRDGPLPADSPTEGLHQHNTSGRLPVVYAHVRLGDGRALVAEFDITRLTQPLQSAGARVRVVDEADRTIVDTHGYLAFTPLADPALKAAAAAARTGRPAGQVDDDTILAARWVASRGPATALRWTVVAEQPIGALGVADDTLRDRARAAALLTVVLAVLLGGWHELVVVRPLRRVAAAAERVAAGELTETVYPQRQDEIGTVASCVDMCRQALVARPPAPVAERRLTGSRS
ncbi:HAMP domain-containing protein [Amycolatopsis xylanica]|uniref:HAMP domain-containing protein n=1 Tax=Amycolatopsis xylanica TaxID=589385 RepID=UPI00115FFFF7|nr:HAMP domain-containing protein [Amycolatopsis xylanica]